MTKYKELVEKAQIAKEAMQTALLEWQKKVNSAASEKEISDAEQEYNDKKAVYETASQNLAMETDAIDGTATSAAKSVLTMSVVATVAACALL